MSCVTIHGVVVFNRFDTSAGPNISGALKHCQHKQTAVLLHLQFGLLDVNMAQIQSLGL